MALRAFAHQARNVPMRRVATGGQIAQRSALAAQLRQAICPPYET